MQRSRAFMSFGGAPPDCAEPLAARGPMIQCKMTAFGGTDTYGFFK